MTKDISFEDALKLLEETVRKLENGNLPLEQAINEYKKGLEFSKICSNKLNTAQELIVKINENGEEKQFKLEVD